MRNALRALAEGKSIPELKFRKGDFWIDMAADLTKVAERLNQKVSPGEKGTDVDSVQSAELTK
jgi:hypothetical protein